MSLAAETKVAGETTPGSAARGWKGLASDIGRVYARPSELFGELPLQNRAASAMLVLIVLHMLYGAAVISTGVVDYEVDSASQKDINRFVREREGDSKAQQLTVEIDALEKGAVFSRLLRRVQLVVSGPVRLIAGLAVLSGVLFVTVAMKGGKPNFPVLAGVVVFAGFVEPARLLVRLLLISQLQTSRIETSAAAFVDSPEVGLVGFLLLRRLDPFELWYWFLIGLGIWRTEQLSRRAAIVAAVVLGVLAAALSCGAEVADFADMRGVTLGRS